MFIWFVVGIVCGICMTLIWDSLKEKPENGRLLSFAPTDTRLNNIPAGILEFDAKGALIMANRFAMAMLNLEHDDTTGLLQMNLKTLAPKDEKGLPFRKEQLPHYKVLRKRRPILNTIIAVHLNGSDKPSWMQVDAEPIFNEAGDLTSVMLFVVDITGKKKQEQLIAGQQNELIHTSRMSNLGVMASGLAHEINNPLAIIKGRVEMARRKFQENQDPADIQKGFAGIEKNIERITTIISALQRYSNAGNYQTIIDTKANDIVEGALQFCRERLQAYDIELRVDSADDDLFVECHSVDIIQALFNLLSNAHHATGNSAKRWIQVTTKDQGDFVEFSVTNSGERVAPETLDKMILPFFTTKAPNMGKGLGLSIAYRLVQNHNGQIYIDSDAINTCFVIRLPKLYSGSYAAA